MAEAATTRVPFSWLHADCVMEDPMCQTAYDHELNPDYQTPDNSLYPDANTGQVPDSFQASQWFYDCICQPHVIQTKTAIGACARSALSSKISSMQTLLDSISYGTKIVTDHGAFNGTFTDSSPVSGLIGSYWFYNTPNAYPSTGLSAVTIKVIIMRVKIMNRKCEFYKQSVFDETYNNSPILTWASASRYPSADPVWGSDKTAVSGGGYDFEAEIPISTDEPDFTLAPVATPPTNRYVGGLGKLTWTKLIT